MLTARMIVLVLTQFVLVFSLLCPSELEISLNIEPGASFSVREGTPISFTFSLGCQPQYDVNIAIKSSSDRVAAFPTQFRITAGAWDTTSIPISAFAYRDAAVESDDGSPLFLSILSFNITSLSATKPSFTPTQNVRMNVYDADMAGFYTTTAQNPTLLHAPDTNPAILGNGPLSSGSPAMIMGLTGRPKEVLPVEMSAVSVSTFQFSNGSDWFTPLPIDIHVNKDGTVTNPGYLFFDIVPRVRQLSTMSAWNGLDNDVSRMVRFPAFNETALTDALTPPIMHYMLVADPDAVFEVVVNPASTVMWAGDTTGIRVRPSVWPYPSMPLTSTEAVYVRLTPISGCLQTFSTPEVAFTRSNFSMPATVYFSALPSSPLSSENCSFAAEIRAPRLGAVVSKTSSITMHNPSTYVGDGLLVASAPGNMLEGGAATITISLSPKPTTFVPLDITFGRKNATLLPRVADILGVARTATALEQLRYTVLLGDACMPEEFRVLVGPDNSTFTLTLVTDEDDTIQSTVARHIVVGVKSSVDPRSLPTYANLVGTAVLSVIDDEMPGVVLSSPSLTVSANATYKISLAAKPSSVVAVTARITAGNTSLVTISPASIAFTPFNWNVSVTVTVKSTNPVTAIHSLQVLHKTISVDPMFNETELLYPTRHTMAVAVIPTDVSLIADNSAPPALVSAVLQETAHEIIVTFDKETSLGGSFVGVGAVYAVDCNNSGIFSPRTVWLLDGGGIYAAPSPLEGSGTGIGTPAGSIPSSCFWQDAATFIVRYASTNPRWPAGGDVIELANGVLRTSSYATRYASGMTRLVGRKLLPLPVYASFDDTGNHIAVNFTAPTPQSLGNVPTTTIFPTWAPCQSIIDVTYLGSGSMCSWTTSSILRIRLGSQSSILPSDMLGARAIVTVAGWPNQLGPLPVPVGECQATSSIRLFAGSVRGNFNSVQFSPLDMCVPVARPSSIPRVTARLGGTSSVGTCDDVVLDASLSSTAGGRPNTVVWSAYPLNPQAALCAGNVTNALASATASKIRLSAAIFVPGSMFTFTVRVSSFLYFDHTPPAEASMNVTVATQPLPQVSVDGPAQVEVGPTTPVMLRMRALLPACGANTTTASDNARLTYKWRVVSTILPTMIAAGFTPSQVMLNDSSLQQHVLSTLNVIRIPSSALQVGVSYTVYGSASVTDRLTGAPANSSNEVAVKVSVSLAGVSARIIGGDRDVGADKPLYLDASASTDLDRLFMVPFDYTWSCWNTSGLASYAVNALNYATLSASSAPCIARDGAVLHSDPSFRGSAKLQVSAGRLDLGTYVFVVNATKGVDGGVLPNHLRWSTSTVTIKVRSGSPPAVFAGVVTGGMLYSGSAVVSSKHTAQLVGYVNTTRNASQAVRYLWTVSEGSPATSLFRGRVDNNTVGIDVAAIPLAGRVVISLTATLTVAGAAIPGAESSSYITLYRAGAPFGGCVNADNTYGTAVTTKFSLGASGWSPATLGYGVANGVGSSLEYMFNFMLGDVTRLPLFTASGSVRDIMDADVKAKSVTLRPLSSTYSPSNRLENVVLPSGNATSNYTLTIVVVVRDASTGEKAYSFMTCSGAPLVLTVVPPARSTTSISAFIGGALGVDQRSDNGTGSVMTQAKSTGDIDVILMTAGALGSIVRPSALSGTAVAAMCGEVGLDCGAHGECLRVNSTTVSCSCKDGYTGSVCDTAPLPIDGAYGEWSEWSSCSLSCGGGIQTRTRSCSPAVNGGAPSPCEAYESALAAGQSLADPPVLSESASCNPEACPPQPIHGGYGPWSDWSQCTSQCGAAAGFFPGVQIRSRQCNAPAPSRSGLTCQQQPELGVATERRKCNTQYCTGSAKRCPGSSRMLAAGYNPYFIPAMECSGNGVCARDPPNCLSSDPDCVATCVCAGKYSGSSCALQADELTDSRNATSLLLQMISDAIVPLDSIESDTAGLAAAALSAVMASQDDLGGTTTTLAAKLVQAILDKSQSQTGTAGAVDSTPLSEAASSNILTVISSINEAVNQPSWTAFVQNGTLDTLDAELGYSLPDLAHSAALACVQGSSAGGDATVLSSDDGALSVGVKREALGERPASITASGFPSMTISLDGVIGTSNTPTAATAASDDAAGNMMDAANGRGAAYDVVVVDWSGTPPMFGMLESLSQDTAIARRLASGKRTYLHSRMLKIVQVAMNLCAQSEWLRSLGCPVAAADGHARHLLSLPDVGKNVGGVRIIDVSDSHGNLVEVQNLTTPVVFEMVIARAMRRQPEGMTCSYYDPVLNAWSDRGVIAIDYRVDPSTGNVLLTCATMHLSAFTSQLAPFAPEYNKVDPIADAGMLANYADPTNIFPLIVLAVIVVGFLLAWVTSFFCIRKDQRKIDSLREDHHLRFGKVERGFGLDKLGARVRIHAQLELNVTARIHEHILQNLGNEADADLAMQITSVDKQLAEVEGRGTLFLAGMFVWSHWVDGLRRSHSWASVFLPPLDEQLVISKPQRIIVLLACILAGMASNAIFFGYEPDNVRDQVVFGILSVVIMLPIEELFPRLFGEANSFSSVTVAEREEKKKIIIRERRNSRASSNRRLSVASDASGRKLGAATPKSTASKQRRSSLVVPLPPPVQAHPQHDRQEAFTDLQFNDSPNANPTRDDELMSSVNAARRHRTSSAFERDGASGRPKAILAEGGHASPSLGIAQTSRPMLTTPTPSSRRRASQAWVASETVDVANTSSLPPLHANPTSPPRLQIRTRPASTSVTSENSGNLGSPFDPGSADSESNVHQPIRRRSVIVSATPDAKAHPVEAAPTLIRAVSYHALAVDAADGENAAGDETTTEDPRMQTAERVLSRAPTTTSRRTFDCQSTMLALSALLAITQAFTGSICMIACLFIVANENGDVEQLKGCTLGILGAAGLLMLLTGAGAYWSARRHYILVNLVLLLIALGVEAAAVMLLWTFDLPYAQSLFVGIGAAQGVPLIVSALALLFVSLARKRLESRLSALHTTKAVAIVMKPTSKEQAAALKMQAAFRGHLGRARSRRQHELRTWNRVRSERFIMLSLVYAALFVTCGILLYLCLLYGVKFESRQTQSWVVGSLLGFLADALVQQPAIELIKVLVSLFMMLCKNSVRTTVVHALAARRDMLLLKQQRGAEGSATGQGLSTDDAVDVGVDADIAMLRRVGVADLLADWKGRRA